MEPINAHGVTLSQAIQDVRREGVDLAGVSPPRDPWVKVGTTTIDGTLEQVAASVVGCDSIPKWVDSDGCERVIDEWMRDRAVLKIGGQHLRPCGSHVNGNRGTALIRCNIVRRQSEIDAERRAVAADGECSSCGAFAHLSTHGTCSRCCDRAENPCPECGPHGNVGRVLLLESWVDCGTCGSQSACPAGLCTGREEDGWCPSCMVRADAEDVASTTRKTNMVLAVGDMVFDEEVEVQRARHQGAAVARADIGLRGAREVAALRSSLTEATVDNLRRYEALMADFKAAITIPNAPPSGYPTHDEYVNYLSARTGPATSPHAAPERPVG